MERRRSKSDTPAFRDEIYQAHYASPQAQEHNNLSTLEVPSDLNINGGEYRPRIVPANSLRGRPPASHPKVAQATRHARRLYFGGFSAATEEDRLKVFLNEIISTGLEEPNDDSYILSIYLNQKKCFAFVELKSIELTTACLSLDGVVMDGLPLKVQRANEYKPEQVPPIKNVIQLNLSRIQFHDGVGAVPKVMTYNSSDAFAVDRMVIAHVDLSMIKRGDIVLMGVYNTTEEVSDVHHLTARRVIKNYFHSVSTSNPEYGVDISDICVVDVGDVQLSAEDVELDRGHSAIQSMVTSIFMAGGYPVLLGSPPTVCKVKANDSHNAEENCLYGSIYGLMSALSDASALISSPVQIGNVSSCSASNVAVLSVSSRIHRVYPHLLSDSRFCTSNPNGGDSCEERLKSFGLQGSHCTMDETRHMLSRGALLTWLTRDIRSAERRQGLLLAAEKNNLNSFGISANTVTGQLFQESLHKLSIKKDPNMNSGVLSSPETKRATRNVVLSLHPDASLFGSAGSQLCPLGARCVGCSDATSQGGEGFSAAEWFDMAVIAGQQKNVVILDLSGWSGVIGCHRLPPMLLGSIFYHFLLGVALSRAHTSESQTNYLSADQLSRNESSNSLSGSTHGRNIFDAFKYNISDGRTTAADESEFSIEDDGPTRRTSVSDSTVPYGLLNQRKTAGGADEGYKTSERPKSLSTIYPSLGIAIPPEFPSDAPRTTPGHGLFTDTPGNFIARGALSVLESPMGSQSTENADHLPTE